MQENTKETIKNEKEIEKQLKTELSDARDVVYSNADNNVDLFVNLLKKFEKIEYQAVMEYFKEYPKEKATNPYKRFIAIYKDRIKFLENEYIKYLKDNKITAPKGVEVDKGICKVKELEQIKKFK